MAANTTNPIHYAGDLRADLMAEAVRVIAARGPAAVSLRALTRELGVSHAAPKNHFRSKEALFAEIAREGFVLFANGLTEAGDRARADGAGPLQVLEAQGLAYLDFARNHRSHFALMFRTDLFDRSSISEESEAAFAVLQSAVLAAQRAGWNRSADARHVASLVWATVHGHAHLEDQGMLLDTSGEGRLAVIQLVLGTGGADQTDPG